MSNLCYRCFHEYEGAGPCPKCGYERSAQKGKYPLALQPGSVLGGKYIVGRVLGEGGFGITYAAQDYDSKGLVAIKEHFPSSIVTRTNHIYVSLISESMLDAFLEGKDKFLAEAKTLSQFNGLGNICDIYSYFEENGTAYFAMEYVNGIPLDEYIKKQGHALGYEEATRLLLPVMEALSHVHEKGIIHRDIAPDNIMVSPEGHVMIIDFGAARYSMGEKSRSLDVILKHGFAPREQYNRHGRQGAYTDVYAMAATYYYAITGKVPQDALDRLDEDRLLPPSRLGVKMPKKAESALMKALAINSNQRWQSMADFAEALKKELPPDRSELERQQQLKLLEQQKKQEEQRRRQQALEEKKRIEAEARKQKQLEKEEQRRKTAEERKARQQSHKPPEASSGEKKKAPIALIAAVAAIVLLAVGVLGFKAVPESPAVPEVTATTAPTVSVNTPAPTATETHGNIHWELSSEGTLYISGEGDMEDYASGSELPWYEKHNDVKSLVISEGVTSIGNCAFYYCDNLDSITIPESVTSIGDYAFYYCKGLTNITIPEHVTSIGSNAFSGCEKLAGINIPDSVTSIGDNVFSGCSSLSSVAIPEGVSSIGKGAFYNCTNLREVSLPESISYLGDGVFRNCENLSTVNIPQGVTSIGHEAFCNCTALRSITLPEGISFIGSLAFSDCESLSSIELPDSVDFIGMAAFTNCVNLSSVRLPESIYSSRYSNSPDLPIPIGSWVFSNCPSLTSISIPDGVIYIDDCSFTSCINLRNISIPASVTSIGAAAFEGCSVSHVDFSGSEQQWNSMQIADNNEALAEASIRCRFIADGNAGENLSWKLENDGSLYISGKGEMPDYSEDEQAPWHEYRERIISVELSEGISTIGDSALQGCSNLSTVSMPDSLSSIGMLAFQGCKSLYSIELGDAVVSIGDSCFSSCEKLNNISLPATLKTIGDSAFLGCNDLRSIYYRGSEVQWKSIRTGMFNHTLMDAAKYYNS